MQLNLPGEDNSDAASSNSRGSQQTRKEKQQELNDRLSQNSKAKRDAFIKQSSLVHSSRYDAELKNLYAKDRTPSPKEDITPENLQKAALDFQTYSGILQQQIDSGSLQ